MKTLLLVFLLVISPVASAHSALVLDITNDQIIYQEDVSLQRPIASLTKLMTALIVVESNLDLDQRVKYRGGIFKSKSVSRLELLESLLIRSDNAAAEALAKSWPGGRSEFISQMNARAEQLGMEYTDYFDPSGLDNRNVSTAIDLSKLIIVCSHYPLISNISSTKYLTVERKYRKKIKKVSVGNTNKLLFEFDNIVLSKTGTTTAAGRCLALMVEKNNRRYAIVILGERTVQDREDKARNLIFNYVSADLNSQG